ncbi:hypothetical protein J4573_49020 [Actinomadura barringtoniae]|uniref:Uncharacterized protein n=1 Tax=Actinomadura barringtoniae TaxID=1427535 RepID=A0A939PU62_9ACTN|nr:hypothetical protein [Actinomadura barringtoniae]MBO2455104.1 hypothetical protein [Actinomadura barringtoniae]
MRKTGPMLALLAAVLALITVGTIALVRAVSSEGDQRSASREAASASASASASAAESAATSVPPPPPLVAQTTSATYASHVPGSRAVVAMTVKGSDVIAYVCDGHSLEAWLRGKLYPEGLVRLQGKQGILTGSVVGDTVVGAASLSRKSVMGFRAPVVRAPSGLYRASATVRGAKIVGGWIVLPGGDQVGLVDYEQRPRPAPRLDPAAGSVVVGDDRVPVAPADPTKP